MNFQGFTNKVELINNQIKKTSQDFHNFYLNKKNEYNFLKFFANTNQNILLKANDFYFKNKKLISFFPYLKDYKSLNEIQINENIIEKVVDNIFQLQQINFKNNEFVQFNYLNFLNIFRKKIINQNKFDNYYKNCLKNISTFNSLPLIIAHNDLVPGNILTNHQSVIFIDYDFVMLNNKFFDLASFITETLNDNENLINYFINKCIEKNIIQKNELDILNKVITYQDLLWTYWAQFMYQEKKEKIFKKIFQEKKERLINRKVY